MKFKILESENKNYFKIGLEKNCLKDLNGKFAEFDGFEIDENALNLKQKLYGETKKETIEIQKKNCNQIMKIYDVCVKLIKMLKRAKIDFDGKFYTKNLADKKNNNDFMICAMLEVKFCVKPINRLSASYTFAADYLDMENSLNKMCDFRENKCTKYRDIKGERTTGCCSKTICKFTCNAPCPTWNLACKIIMCDYLIEKKGFYFTPHTIPIMRKHFSFIERAFSIGQLCRTKKKAMFELWLLRAFGTLAFACMVGVIAILLI